MTGLIVTDTETTGFSSETNGVVEIAVVRLNWNGEAYTPDSARHCFVDPEMPIPAEASAVHHITNKDVVDARKLPEAVAYMGFRPADVIVAHNAAFDRSFLPQLQGHKWICTWKCAQKLIPDAPSYGNQVLRYHLGIEVEGGSGRQGQPHSAGYDARTTAGIMAHMLTLASIEDMIQITGAPVLLNKMPFGKHKGQEFHTVPKDYLRWLKGQRDLDCDLKHTLEHHT